MFVINLLPYATPRLRHILAALERQLNKKIDHVSLYIGSAGPSHVLRGGIFFERMKQPEPGPTNFM